MSKGPSDPALKPTPIKIASVLDPEQGRVNAALLFPDGTWMPIHNIPFFPTPKAGCWSWMERA